MDDNEVPRIIRKRDVILTTNLAIALVLFLFALRCFPYTQGVNHVQPQIIETVHLNETNITTVTIETNCFLFVHPHYFIAYLIFAIVIFNLLILLLVRDNN